MAKQILPIYMDSSGHQRVAQGLSPGGVEARFTTMRRARSYLRRLSENNDGEVAVDQLSLEDDLYQIVQVDMDDLPTDPQLPELEAA